MRLAFAIFALSTLLLPFSPPRAVAAPTASEILHAVDHNLQFDTRTSTVTMTVTTGRRSRTYEMVTFARGKQDAAIEYLAPDRDKGTRMLKRGDNLWIYLPDAERVQKISGHMLRQGMMGSDISYEDLMDAADFEKNYQADLSGEEVVGGRPQWRIEAKAKTPSVTYPRRLMWVDKEWLIPTRQELFALSGMKLKVWTMSEVALIEGRRIPLHMEVSDLLRQGSKTVVQSKDVHLGVALKEEVFTMRWVERR